jgi:sugar phosphate isomerase/epimerase
MSIKLGLDVNDLRLPIKEGLRVASDLRFRAVEIGAAEGEASPAALSVSGRRHLARYVNGLGLELASLTADFPQLRLTDPRGVQERVERTRDVLQLARDAGAPIVTAAIGAMTHPESGEPSPLAVEALSRIGEFAESRGVIFAVRPSYDTAERLAGVFKAVGCPALRIGLDPAAMIISGANPLSLMLRFADQISLVHARDGTAGASDRIGQETALGEGDVDFAALCGALREIEFAGASIIRRTSARITPDDLTASAEYLRRFA